MMNSIRVWGLLALVGALLTSALLSGCGPVPKPANAYSDGALLVEHMREKRGAIESFRIAGVVDHYGEEHRIQGKLFLFADLPSKLRVDLLSPFGSSLAVLTIKDDLFSLSDKREGRYLTGPAEPCNIARLIRVALPPKDVAQILIGGTPVIPGPAAVEWSREGHYVVTIQGEGQTQTILVGPDHDVLPVLRSTLRDEAGVVFDIEFDKWKRAGKTRVPYDIRIKMPREKADLHVRYDEDEVELNVSLPGDAWEHSFPEGVEVEEVTCF